MKKQKVFAFNKKVYLLGKDADGVFYWLEAPSWDCGWYWGFGYVENYINNEHPERSKDINCHQHYDSLFIRPDGCIFDNFKKLLIETPLTDDEIWKLCDYMRSFYTLKETAALFQHGYSWQTGKAYIKELDSKDLAEQINKNLLPKLFEKIENMLTPNEEKEITNQ